MTRKRFQKLLISEGVPPKRARNYKFDRSKMIFAYSVDYGKSYYIGSGKSYQELWDNRIYVPPEWTLQPFHETKKYMEFMNFNFPHYFF